ncbi:MAG TPA: phosphate regulon sensor histidine kinase PhoR [Gammaproteobacteria bacterium]|nr:phosphate regulon sensor histidine kinase PhoR [Gammaproteobacteria bacterium]
MPRRWISQFIVLGIWLAAAALIGLAFGAVAAWLAGALGLYLIYSLRNLYLLDQVLEGGKRVPVFETRGLWAETFARVARLKAKTRNRKKKYNRLLREVRESTGALSDGGIILNSAHEIIWFNPAATRLLGLDPARDIGNRIDNLLRHPDFVRYVAAPTGEPVVVPSPEDEGDWLAVQLIPYGQKQHLAIVRDVTRERRLETARRDFVANASHELRSPLTVIAGYLDSLAEDEGLPASWTRPIAEMQRQAERMTQILRDLIELTRLDAAERRAPQRFVDVPAMLGLIVEEFRRRSAQPRLGLHLDTEAGLLGSESELHSVFHNLISNAMRFTPPTGTIEVHWRPENGGTVFDVIDTGIGIPEEQIPRITERFYRVDPGRSRASGGTGLGLAIVKHALQRHAATLEISSREGEGSRFSCHFPAARVAARANPAKAAG